MTKYYLYMAQRGGCDYTIACGQKLQQLQVGTMEAAIREVYGDEETDGWLRLHDEAGLIDAQIDAQILEVLEVHKIDLRSRAELREAQAEADEKLIKGRLQYEALKKVFEKGGV